MSMHKKTGPDGPKGSFRSAARRSNDPNLPGSEADEEIRATGDTDPDEPELAAAKRRKKLEEAFEAEEAAKAGDNETHDGAHESGYESTDEAPDPGAGTYSFSGLGRYRIRDRGDYLSIRGKGKLDPRTGQREITDDQLKMLLLTAILGKGFTKEIALYRGGRIDSTLTTRARIMLLSDRGLQDALQGRNPNLATSLKAEPPPWERGWLGEKLHASRYKEQIKKSIHEDDNSRYLFDKKLNSHFKDVNGRLLTDVVRKHHEEETGQPYAKSPIARAISHLNLFS